MGNKSCPCCGYLTIPTNEKNQVFSGFICPACYWEIDSFIKNENEKSDQNHGLTLAEARLNYSTFGACHEKMIPYVLDPTDDFE
jgi:hypothetical protein